MKLKGSYQLDIALQPDSNEMRMKKVNHENGLLLNCNTIEKYYLQLKAHSAAIKFVTHWQQLRTYRLF